MPVIHNSTLSALVKERYSLKDLDSIRALLERHGTFSFPALPNGLFPAAGISGRKGDAGKSGYHYVWVRDNVHVAHAHYVNGDKTAAARNALTLAEFFARHLYRFREIIGGEADPDDPMNRPHVRFDGMCLEEIGQEWAHAENDALGYFLWFFSRLAMEGVLTPAAGYSELLEAFPAYFRKIRYWEDEDSGHWEEKRKIEASSIGVVVGALRELKELYLSNRMIRDFFRTGSYGIDLDCLEELISLGEDALEKILPSECIQEDPLKRRRYDAALLFLIHPVGVVEGEMADRILADVVEHLRGDYGVRRYPGDSYWCADYKMHLPADKRTVDFSKSMKARDALLKEGEEAQWCIFDPIISIIHGKRFRMSGEETDLAAQTEHFNRSLGQLTGEDSIFGPLKCPELYYLENGRYTPNDHTPLLWTQANLLSALKFMEENLLLARG